MKYKIGVGVLLLCIGLVCAWVIQFRAAAESADALAVAPRWVSAPLSKPVSLGGSQFAYVSSSKGIYEYRLAQNGRLEPLTGKPVKGSPVNARLYADPQTGGLFAIKDTDDFVERPITDRIYCYTVSKNGLLTPPSSGPTKAGLSVGDAKLDCQHHLLYLLGFSYTDSQDEVVIYDVTRPMAPVKRQVVPLSVGYEAPALGSLLLNQKGTALFLLGRYEGTHKTGRTGAVQFYPITNSAASPLGPANYAQTEVPLGGGVAAESYLILGDRADQITVCKSTGKTFEVVSVTSLSNKFSEFNPGKMVYRKSGSILYVASYAGPFNSQIGPPLSAILAYRLGKNGSLAPLLLRTAPVGHDPTIFLDSTGRFLYIIGAEDKIAVYKSAPDGQLSSLNMLVKVAAPSSIVFFGGVPPKG